MNMSDRMREKETDAKFLFDGDGDGDDVVIESIHNHPVLLFSITILFLFLSRNMPFFISGNHKTYVYGAEGNTQ